MLHFFPGGFGSAFFAECFPDRKYTMPKIAFVGKTDVGLKRTNNEDAFVVKSALRFCLAADGMGGAAAGELASSIFAETAKKVFAGSVDRTEKEAISLVKKSFASANRRILDHVGRNKSHEGMGCTAELLVFYNSGYALGHIGDSRTYRLRQGALKQLTQDHSFVQDQINQGLISLEEAKNHHLRNVILRAVGVSDKLSLDILKGKILQGDLFLLCSDGLTDMVEDSKIQQVLSAPTPLPQKADELIDAAKSAGGNDNITVVLSHCE